MVDGALQEALQEIEARLREEGRPIKVGALLQCIKDDVPGVRDIDLREAVWLLIGRGTIILNPERELVLPDEVGAEAAVKQMT